MTRAGAAQPSSNATGAASKLAHVCTADDPLVRQMLDSFNEPGPAGEERPAEGLGAIDTAGVAPLEEVIAVGGCLSSIPNPLAPQKVVGYVKIAAVRVGLKELDRLKAPVVNPESIRRILSGDADVQSAVLPVGNVRIPGRTLFQSVRHALHATFERFWGGALYDTLEYLVGCGWDADAEPWRTDARNRPHFVCPFCDGHVSFPRPLAGARREFRCRSCHAGLTLVDYLGLVSDASDNSSDSAVAMNLKGVLEHLVLLTFLRRLVDSHAGAHRRAMLLYDGALMLRGQCARLVEPIRGYLRFLADGGVPFFLAGVEQEGAFPGHRRQIEDWLKADNAVFVPGNRYALDRIKHAGGAAAVYGRRGLYGSKAFCRLDACNVLVVNAPNRRHGFGAYAADPRAQDFVGFDRILATLKALASRQFPGVPLPLMAVNRLASLPYYPANDLLGRYPARA